MRLSDYFSVPATSEAGDRELNLVDVRERVPYQRQDGTSEEIDVIAKADDGSVLMIEVRKRKERTSLKAVTDLRDNALDYAEQFGVTACPAFLSLGGFTEEATTFCEANGIAMADEMTYYS